MAISKNDALTFFLGLSKGAHFWAQRYDGQVDDCQFVKFTPDDENTPTTGVVEFGVSILPIDADFEVSLFNLDSLEGDLSIYSDFVQDLELIDYSPVFNPSQAGVEISESSTDFVYTSSSSVTEIINHNLKSPKLMTGRLFVSSDSDPFSEDVTLSIYHNSATRGDQLLFRKSFSLIQTDLSGATVIGNSTVEVTDNSNFQDSDLAVILDTSNEFFRVGSIPANIEAEDNILAVHSVGQPVSRVMEFGGFSIYDSENSGNMYVKVESVNSITATLTLDLVFSS